MRRRLIGDCALHLSRAVRAHGAGCVPRTRDRRQWTPRARRAGSSFSRELAREPLHDKYGSGFDTTVTFIDNIVVRLASTVRGGSARTCETHWLLVPR